MRGLIKRLRRRAAVASHLRRNGNAFAYRGLRLDVPDSVPLALRYPLSQGTYEQSEIALIERYLPADRPVIELGGCIGVVSAFLRSRLDEAVPMVTLEANPELIEICRGNVARQRGGTNGKVLLGAAAYGSGEVAFQIGRNPHVSKLAHGGDARTVTVPAFGLARIAKELPPDAAFSLVCDIEGAELDLFAHDQAMLTRCPLAIVETHPNVYRAEGRPADALLQLARAAGFSLVDQVEDVCVFRRGDDASAKVLRPV